MAAHRSLLRLLRLHLWPVGVKMVIIGKENNFHVSSFDYLLNGIKNGQIQMLFSSLSGRYATDELSAILYGLFTVERSLFAGKSLTYHFAVRV